MAKSGIGASIPALLVIIVGIIVIILIWKNKNLLTFGSSITAGAAIEASVPGPNVYPVVAQITPPGEYGLSTASGGDGEPSYRDNITFPCDKCARETTWFVIPGNPGDGGMDLSIKMGSHEGGNDNGSLIAFSQVPLGGSGGSWACERPHGTNGQWLLRQPLTILLMIIGRYTKRLINSI